MSGVSIKVAIRCRPFTNDDKLGVVMHQSSDEEGEIELINCDYSNTRFPFTYAWWSAYGYERHLKGVNMKDADSMQLINQDAVYASCGMKIKNDLMTGNAVVLFAYGLSGSGKTFTVFGPDASDSPEAWFKHSTPHHMWGIFPRLAYEIFNERQDGWKVTMKYFQNVVDIVRDLMSPNGEEQHYKNGMRKDPDGFMDIEWCCSKVIHSWDDLRHTFQIANARKAIASTQFNPMSTRGHCIMVLELEMPHPENPDMKQRGRLYVCDLAGTEPAGDIVSAQYNKVVFPNGDIEYKYVGAHSDVKKTKELQDQGKKINLSLSEMAQFFMKMAEAFMKKKLQPGMTIPGCNSFFLCKYLKDTMLQAKTYLFCAIRPEVDFMRYTFSTLNFAKNASVVKLAPKKATVSASAQERKLMAELEAMKALVAQLQSQAMSNNTKTDSSDSERMIQELQAKLEAKQNDLQRELTEQDDVNHMKRNNDIIMRQQREEYAKRGISLYEYDNETNKYPYLLNLDEDAFRSNRFMFILCKDTTIFGPKGDIQPTSLSVIRDHCRIVYKAEESVLILIGGKGDTWHNGKPVASDEEIRLQPFDRIAFADQLTILRWPDHEPVVCDDYGNIRANTIMTAEDAVAEYQEGIINYRLNPNKNKVNDSNSKEKDLDTDKHLNELNEERKKLKEERDKWEKEKSVLQSQRNEEEYQRLMAAIDNQILDLLPKVKEAKTTVDLLNRITMTFDVTLEKGLEVESLTDMPDESNDITSTLSACIPKVKIIVENSMPKYSVLIDPANFLSKLSLLKDETMKLRNAIENGRDYEIPERHDPLYLMFDNDFLLGTTILFSEYLLYNLETEEKDQFQEIKNAAVPYNTIGLLEATWTPLPGPNEEDWTSQDACIQDIDSEEDLLGKSWTYKLEIKQATNLPLFCELAYVQYEFFGETFVTEAIQQQTYSPVFEYVKIHHIPHVTPEFLKFLKKTLQFHVYCAQHIDPPTDKISTSNPVVYESIKTGEPKAYEISGAVKPKSEFEIKCEFLSNELLKSQDENTQLKARIAELETKLSEYEVRLQNANMTQSTALLSKSPSNRADSTRIKSTPPTPKSKMSDASISKTPTSKVAKSLGSAKIIDTIVNGDKVVSPKNNM